MQNDPGLDPKFMGIISSDFVKVAENLKEASYLIRQRGFSNYPIFPISREHLPIGSLLYEIGHLGIEWNYFASYLDEFIQRKLIKNEQDFIDAFRNPDEFCCLFVVEPSFTNFVFIPYPED